MNNITENIIEISWLDQYMLHKGWYKQDIDSLDRKSKIIELAKEFEEKYNTDDDYYGAIITFAQKELLKEFGV